MSKIMLVSLLCPSSSMLYALFAIHNCIKSSHTSPQCKQMACYKLPRVSWKSQISLSTFGFSKHMLKVLGNPFQEMIFFLNLFIKEAIDHSFKIMGFLKSKLTLTVNHPTYMFILNYLLLDSMDDFT